MHDFEKDKEYQRWRENVRRWWYGYLIPDNDGDDDEQISLAAGRRDRGASLLLRLWKRAAGVAGRARHLLRFRL